MGLTDRLKRWWSPAEWQENHPLSEEERAEKAQHQTEDEYINPQHGIGAESYDRVDVDRDFRKP